MANRPIEAPADPPVPAGLDALLRDVDLWLSGVDNPSGWNGQPSIPVELVKRLRAALLAAGSVGDATPQEKYSELHYPVGGYYPQIRGYKCVCGGHWNVYVGEEPVHHDPVGDATPPQEK